MYKGQRIILIAPAYNEESKIVEVIRRVPPGIIDKILIVDDGSTRNNSSLHNRRFLSIYTDWHTKS